MLCGQDHREIALLCSYFPVAILVERPSNRQIPHHNYINFTGYHIKLSVTNFFNILANTTNSDTDIQINRELVILIRWHFYEILAVHCYWFAMFYFSVVATLGFCQPSNPWRNPKRVKTSTTNDMNNNIKTMRDIIVIIGPASFRHCPPRRGQ